MFLFCHLPIDLFQGVATDEVPLPFESEGLGIFVFFGHKKSLLYGDLKKGMWYNNSVGGVSHALSAVLLVAGWRIFFVIRVQLSLRQILPG